MKVTVDDVRALYCTAGARRWFENHGLDFRTFLQEGIEVETFLAVADHLGREVVRHKLAREANLTEVRVNARDANRLFCAVGTRAWCRENGIDERRFFAEGVAASELLALDNPLADQVVMAKVKKEMGDV